MPSVITCPSCGAKNRVGVIPRGTPRCARCKNALPWIVHATEATFADETQAGVPVLVDFWAPWCGPCRMVEPVLEQLAAERAGSLKVVKVNVDENPGLASRFQAMSIPLLVLIRDGDEVDRVAGALPKAQLESRLAL
jgi:thioredoxin 2